MTAFDRPSYQFKKGDDQVLKSKWDDLMPSYNRLLQLINQEKGIARWYSFHEKQVFLNISQRTTLDNYADAREDTHLMFGGKDERLRIYVIERPQNEIESVLAFLNSSSARLLGFDGKITSLISSTETDIANANREADVLRKQADELTKRIADISSPLGTFKFQDPQTILLFPAGLAFVAGCLYLAITKIFGRVTQYLKLRLSGDHNEIELRQLLENLFPLSDGRVLRGTGYYILAILAITPLLVSLGAGGLLVYTLRYVSRTLDFGALSLLCLGLFLLSALFALFSLWKARLALGKLQVLAYTVERAGIDLWK